MVFFHWYSLFHLHRFIVKNGGSKGKSMILFTLYHTAETQALGQRQTLAACGLYFLCQLGMENRERRRKLLIFFFPLVYCKQNMRNQLHAEKINAS